MTRRGPKTQPKTTATPGPVPDPPDWLTDPRSLEFWNRYALQLNALGLLENLDATAFAMLCDGVVAYLDASEQLVASELVQTVGKNGAQQQNPLVSIIRQQAKGVRELLAEFGMTPQSRTALTGSTSATPIDAEQDPFELLLKQYGDQFNGGPKPKKRTTRTASRKRPAKRSNKGKRRTT